MSERNGVIEIGDEGFTDVLFKRGDKGITITLDVIKCNDRWVEQDWTFRDENGQIIKGKEEEQRAASEQFVHNVVQEWVNELPNAVKRGDMTAEQAQEKADSAVFVMQRFSMAQVVRFHNQIALACKKLKGFFSGGTGDEQSSPAPLGTVVYSE